MSNAQEMRLVDLVHEIWVETDEHGTELPSCCPAGPDGDDFRARLAPDARLIHTFKAGNHVEAMNIYYGFFGWAAYVTNFASDYEPYPAERLERQTAKKS